jgi:hypothetical protein
VLYVSTIETQNRMPMQHFTQNEFQPNSSTILFIKQFARMCNAKKNQTNGYNGFAVAACS